MTESLNHDLVLVKNDQEDMIVKLQEGLMSARAKTAEIEFEKNAQIQELSSAFEEQTLEKDTELDEVKAKLQCKEREFEVLTQEMFERSKSKFREIDVLKKQLTEAERSLVRVNELCFMIF